MNWEKKELVIFGIYSYFEPEKLLFRVLTDDKKPTDMPWPFMFSNGLFHKLLKYTHQISQKDCLNDRQLYMTHSLWTCDCDPNKGHTVIHVSPTNYCIDCHRNIRDYDKKIKHWHEVLKYEPKPYEYNEKEALKYAEEFFKFEENKGNNVFKQ